MFIVEGNIGAGKSTFLKIISQNLPKISVSFEPVDNWTKPVNGESILEKFIKNPKRWALTMEIAAMSNRVQEHIKDQNHKHSLKLIERSIYSGHYCFAKNGYNSGYFSPIEWSIYNQWFELLIPDNCKPPKGFIYLRTKPEIAYNRIIKRNRSAEKTMSLKYIQNIHNSHEDFLISKKNIIDSLKQVPILVLNCNKEFESDIIYQKEIIDLVKQFISQNKD